MGAASLQILMALSLYTFLKPVCMAADHRFSVQIVLDSELAILRWNSYAWMDISVFGLFKAEERHKLIM
jgi:hypothetical protein